MLLTELFDNNDDDDTKELTESAKIAWARVGNKVVKKYRCTAGIRQGRVVSSPADCNKPIDIKKRVKLRQTKLARAGAMKQKRKRTLQRNPASLRIQKMNKSM